MIHGRGEDGGISSFVQLTLPADILTSLLMQCITDKGDFPGSRNHSNYLVGSQAKISEQITSSTY